MIDQGIKSFHSISFICPYISRFMLFFSTTIPTINSNVSKTNSITTTNVVTMPSSELVTNSNHKKDTKLQHAVGCDLNSADDLKTCLPTSLEPTLMTVC